MPWCGWPSPASPHRAMWRRSWTPVMTRSSSVRPSFGPPIRPRRCTYCVPSATATPGSLARVFVKICGITNESDALLAVAMGADAVGFVFAPSPRQIAPTVAREIARRLPPEILTVGVFRGESAQRIVEIVNSMGLRGAQLHGRESAAEAKWVADREPFTIKAFGIGDHLLEKVAEYPVSAVMLDSVEPGSGQV